MKRISWTLNSYELPDFKIYDKLSHTSSMQVPIASENRPPDNSYFIGTVPNTDPVEKLLCYHTTSGQYIVISYNYSSARLFQDVLSTGMYEIEVAGYNPDGETITKQNPPSVPIITL